MTISHHVSLANFFFFLTLAWLTILIESQPLYLYLTWCLVYWAVLCACWTALVCSVFICALLYSNLSLSVQALTYILVLSLPFMGH